jgi:hypothetical protein
MVLLELQYQLSNSGAKVAFASRETLPAVRACALRVGIPAYNVFLFEDRKVSGINTFCDLLDYGELQWERLHTLDQVTDT